MKKEKSDYLSLAYKVCDAFKIIPSIESIVLGGSQTSSDIDKHSDIDLYIYTTDRIPVELRSKIITKLGYQTADIGLTYWDDGDEWFDKETGIEVDLIYWHTVWIKDEMEGLLNSNYAKTGYSTSFWHTILNSKCLFDRSGWFADFKSAVNISYPKKLQKAVIAKNYPVLKEIIPSYYNQIKKAVERNDLVSINHRTAEFLASYFDIIFAVNKLPNPGEKKVMRFIQENCKTLPADLEIQIGRILTSASLGGPAVIDDIDALLENLNDLLKQENLI